MPRRRSSRPTFGAGPPGATSSRCVGRHPSSVTRGARRRRATPLSPFAPRRSGARRLLGARRLDARFYFKSVVAPLPSSRRVGGDGPRGGGRRRRSARGSPSSRRFSRGPARDPVRIRLAPWAPEPLEPSRRSARRGGSARFATRFATWRWRRGGVDGAVWAWRVTRGRWRRCSARCAGATGRARTSPCSPPRTRCLKTSARTRRARGRCSSAAIP
mmetsp:Transcript_8488/g.34714  ORF Transcript_8488/g.34714 Transcript_8488/m.34714 type:complete len:216 (+) Transcript_8488:4130-4777(+)